MILSKKRITKALISLRRCAGWSAPLLIANPRRQVYLKVLLHIPAFNTVWVKLIKDSFTCLENINVSRFALEWNTFSPSILVHCQFIQMNEVFLSLRAFCWIFMRRSRMFCQWGGPNLTFFVFVFLSWWGATISRPSSARKRNAI